MRNDPPIRLTKRLTDIAVSSVALALFAPVMAALAIWIKVVSPGPVFYVAPRVGLRGRRFGQIKLRTMHINADKLGTFTAKRDPRIIKGGEIIRTVRLDELPQFFNVLKGEMSVVGPRPEDIDTVENHFTQRYRRTLDVLPGLTGIRQIRNWPHCSDLTPDHVEDEQQYYFDVILPYSIEMDLEYVDKQGFWFDLYLLVATAWAVGVKSWWIPVFGGRTASPEDGSPPRAATGKGRLPERAANATGNRSLVRPCYAQPGQHPADIRDAGDGAGQGLEGGVEGGGNWAAPRRSFSSTTRRRTLRPSGP